MVLVVEVCALFSSHHGTGDILAVVAGILYAAYLLVTQKVRCHVDTLTFMTFSVTAGAVLLLVLNISLGHPLVGYSGRSWSYMILLAVVSQVGGGTVSYALGHLKATIVSVSLLGQVLVTVVLAMPILGEVLNIREMVGGIFILIGIYLVNTRRLTLIEKIKIA
jgi:drug/metabolite transporter (DMT)-like permease